MSFCEELPPDGLRRQVSAPSRSRDVASVEGAVQGGRSPAKRTVYSVGNANMLKGLGLVAASSRVRPAARTSPPSGRG